MASTDTETTEPQQIYWIGCSGTGYIVMDEERLTTILEGMPTLRFLLMGHPQMAETKIEQRDDGTKVVEIPVELQIQQSSFLLLINCLLENEPLPPRNKQGDDSSRLTELSETITKLGGCPVLENRLKDLTANPMTPEDDVNREFAWAVIQYDTIFQSRMMDMMKLGYSFTITKKIERENHHFFRAKPGTPAPPSATTRRQQPDAETALAERLRQVRQRM